MLVFLSWGVLVGGITWDVGVGSSVFGRGFPRCYTFIYFELENKRVRSLHLSNCAIFAS